MQKSSEQLNAELEKQKFPQEQHEEVSEQEILRRIKLSQEHQHSGDIHLLQEQSQNQEELANLRSELGIESGAENGLEEILSPEQLKFLEKENKIRGFTLESNGKINNPELDEDLDEQTKEKLQIWKAKEGVIDVSNFDGVMVIVYNAEEKVPDGCRDLRFIESHGGKGRAGEYDPVDDICSVDISGTYSFLEDKHKAEWVQNIMRHEMRHGLVNHEDIKLSKETSGTEQRDSDVEKMDPEKYAQLTYLDELHSQYMDVLEGDVQGKNSFRTIRADFYTTAAYGNHLEVASKTEEGKKAAAEMFSRLQGFIISKRMSEKDPYSALSKEIDDLSMAAGTILATERGLSPASEKIEKLWGKLANDPKYKEKIKQFLKEYKPEPTGADNTPEVESMPEGLFERI